MKASAEILEDLKKSYDSKAKERAGKDIQWWKKKEREQFLSKFKKGRKRRMLELGCGTGQDAIYFKSKGFGVVCTDLSPKNVEICIEKGLDAQEMSFFDLDFQPSSFEAIYAMNSLLHVPHESLGQVLDSINNLLAPSGIFYMGVYGGQNKEGPIETDDYEPKRFFASYTDSQIIQIVSEFFDLLYFHRVELERTRHVHFQSMILRSKKGMAEGADSGPTAFQLKANPDQF
jgi:SAM-dependent methyltransferase